MFSRRLFTVTVKRNARAEMFLSTKTDSEEFVEWLVSDDTLTLGKVRRKTFVKDLRVPSAFSMTQIDTRP
jgi:hypothetical protein